MKTKILRIVFYLVMVSCLLGGMINGIRAYYLVFFFQLGLLLVSFCLNIWTILSFSYVQKTDERRAVKGGSCTLHVGIYNDKPFPFTMMRVHVGMVGQEQEQVLTINLSPRASIAFDLPVLLPYRGQYDIGMTVLEITDIFGLLPMRFDMRRLSYYRQIPLLIYPKLNALRNVRPNAGDEKNFAALHLHASSEGDSFSQVRAYQSGDSAKRIHWKLFAGRRSLYTRQYDVPSEARTMIFLANTPQNGDEGCRYADICCECAAALAYYNLEHGDTVQLVETNTRRKAVTALSLGGFWPLYDWLAKLPFDADGKELASIVDGSLRRNTQVHSLYLIGDQTDETLCQVLQRALTQGIQVTCILAQTADETVMPEGIRVIRVHYGDDIEQALGNII